MQFKQPGPWLSAVGMVGLGLADLYLFWIPDLPLTLGWLLIPPLYLIVAGAGMLFRRTGLIAASALAVYWLAWLVLKHIPALAAEPGEFPLWVSAAQALTFAAVAAALVRPGLWIVTRLVLGATLALFGGVHILNPGVVGGLLPDWFPVSGVWPYVTGALQIAAGAMILIGFRTAIAAIAIGLMWLSWIPLVHLPRLIASPGSAFEWTFMITALALAGAAWTVGERIAAKPGEDLQSSAH